jgi:hypothetical protein
MMITSTQTLIYANDDDPEMENKEVDFLEKILFYTITSLNDVITSNV